MKEYRFRYGDGEVVIPLDEGQVLGELHGNHAKGWRWSSAICPGSGCGRVR